MTLKGSVFARLRPERLPADGSFIVAVRWAINPGYGLGVDCYSLWRSIDRAPPVQVYPQPLATPIGAPGAIRAAKPGDWIIDLAALRHHAEVRASTPAGLSQLPAFRPGAAVDELDPILLFALNRPAFDALDARLADLIERLGPSHLANDDLATRFWPRRAPPDFAELQQWRISALSSERAKYQAVRRHYRRVARERLEVLSLDFGFARFLGLGVDDILPAGTLQMAAVEYSLCFGAATPPLDKFSVRLYERLLPPPKDVAATPTPGQVGHRMFADFLSKASAWTPPSPCGLDDELADAVRRSALGKRSASKIAAITWNPLIGDDAPGRPPQALSVDDPVFWKVERYAFPNSAGNNDQPDPTGAPFTTCRPDELFAIARKKGVPLNPPIFLDDPAPIYGEPPMIGWFAYRVTGIDLFGIAGRASEPKASDGGWSPAIVLLRDDEAPEPPRVEAATLRIDYPEGDGSIDVEANIAWEQGPEFLSPDAKNFHIKARWRHLQTTTVEIVKSDRLAGALGNLQANIACCAPGGAQVIPYANLRQHAGSRLTTPSNSFWILPDDPGADYSLRVRRSQGESPPLGAAFMSLLLPDMAREDSQTIARKPSVPVRILLTSLEPLRLSLTATMTGDIVRDDEALVYVHVLGLSLRAELVGGVATVDEDTLSDTAKTLIAQLRALSPLSAQALLAGSPGLILPAHRIAWRLTLPVDFSSGRIDLSATTSDDAFYRNGPNGPGNESEPGRPAQIFVVCAKKPGKPAKVRKIWAKGSALYQPYARAEIRWDKVQGAKRYDVDYALETRLLLPLNCSDEELIKIAKAAADSNFERRTSAALTHIWVDDKLPGAAPVRAIYRVRAVSQVDKEGDWAVVALVRVPDTRIASPPNLFLVQPAPTDRTLILRWTQPGDLSDLGFAVEARTTRPASDDVETGWAVVAEYLPGMIQPGAGASFEATLVDLAPGVRWQIRVKAIRHALDPIDPLAKLRRRIEGRPSNIQHAMTRGQLRPPSAVSARKTVSGGVEIRWQSEDAYEALELQVRKPGATGFEREPLPLELHSHSYLPATAISGAWRFRILASARGVSAFSDPYELDL